MTLGDSVLAYSEFGSGEPVVLLDWTPWQTPALAQALATRYRVIGIEPPDAGHASESTHAIAEVVTQTADFIGVPSYALVGTSVGADIALRIALMRPSGISSLVLVSPASILPADSWPILSPAEACETMLAHPEGAGIDLPEYDRTQALATLAARSKSDSSDIESQLHDLYCATLTVFGQEDRMVSRQAGHLWKERMPNCSVCYVYDAGHAVGVERPDALATVVLDFVERRETFIVENRSSIINP